MKKSSIQSENIEKAVNYLNNYNKLISEETKKTLSELIREKVQDKFSEVMGDVQSINEDDDEELEINADEETNDSEDTSLEDTESDDEMEETEEEEEESVESKDSTDMSDEFSFEDEPVSDEEDTDEWSQLEKYKVSDDEYDFSNASEEDVIKVYKLLKDEDQIIFKKDEDNLKIIDKENDEEYLIDLNGDGILPNENDNTDEEFDVTEDELKGMVESVLSKCNVKPKKTFGKNRAPKKMEDEIEESAGSRTSVTQNRIKIKPKGAIQNAKSGRPIRQGALKVSESNYSKLEKEVLRLREERQEAIKVLGLFKKNLEEALVVNNNLGKIVKLVTEHTTTKAEKIEIVKRFGAKAKTVEQSNNLYETINNELKRKTSIVEGNKKIDITVGSNVVKAKETPLYESVEIREIRDLISRTSK